MTATDNEIVVLYEPADRLTAYPDVAVVGRRAVKINASKASGANVHVVPCTAAAKPLGIAAYDAAIGETVTVVRMGVVSVDAGATVTAGQEVEIDATGRVITLASGKAIGLALNDATVGVICYVALAI
jgi:hypothetical protein